MNKEIRYLIIEISLILLLLIFGLPKMLNLNSERIKTTQSMLDNSSSLSIKNEDLSNNILMMATDEYAKDNIDKSILTISNNTTKKKKYNIILVINKNTTIELNDVKIIINNSISLLSDNISYEDNDNYYYNIYTSNVNKTCELEFAMWLRDDIENFTGGSLSYYFAVEEDNTYVLK